MGRTLVTKSIIKVTPFLEVKESVIFRAVYAAISIPMYITKAAARTL